MFTQLHAQDMVVSEYFNNPGPAAAKEWTELLVVKDNLNVVGWTVHDHSDFTPVGGPTFNDIPLFRNLRAGTIIVIDHRLDSPPQKLDTIADDGFLLLYQFDARFFTTGGGGLDINQPGELVIIEDDNNKPVHALGHYNSKNIQPAAYTDLTCPKIAYDAPSQLSNNHSNRVTGRTLAAYNAGLGTDSASYGPQIITAPPEDPGTGPSKGLPNLIDNNKRLAKRTNTNHLFWRETRQPAWSATPTISVNSSDLKSNTLSWTSLVDPRTQDLTTGYLVLRDTAGFAPATFPGIRDGAIYTIGDLVGTARVVALQTTSKGNTFTDSTAPCGSSFSYRVYGYRYAADNSLTVAQTADTTARGRQYTESEFAQSSVISKPKPPKPTIFVTRSVICPGDTTTLWTTATTGIEQYTWLRNGVPLAIGFTTSGVVRQPGIYRLVVTAPGGCTEVSNDIEITPMPAPAVSISLAGIQSLCIGDTMWLNVNTKAQSYELLKNNVVVASQTGTRFAITSAGVYAVRIKTGTACDGISDEVTITTPDVRYSFLPDSINFGTLGQCQPSATKKITLKNEGTQPITISSVVMPPGFALSSPAAGFVVPAGAQQEVEILFSPSTTGISAGMVTVTATPCDITKQFAVIGNRAQATASLNKVDVDFGTYTTCPGTSINDTIHFEITNSGSADITVTPPKVAPPFYTSFSKVVLKPGQTAPIVVRYIPIGADLNRAVTQTISFPYKDAICSDSLSANATLRAASFQPNVSALSDSVFAGISKSCTDTLEGSITLRNSGTVASTVSQIVGTNVSYSGLPIVIPAGQTRSVQFEYVVTGGAGMVSEIDTVILEPCSIRLPVTIAAQMQPPAYSAPDSVNMGTTLLCAQESPLTSQYTLLPSTTQTGAVVRSVVIDPPFTTTLSANTPIGDSLIVSVNYVPVSSGTSRGFIMVVLEPCGDTVKTELIATANTMLRSTIIDDNNFGTLSPGGTSRRSLLIENTGTNAFTVHKISNVNSPWTVVTETPGLPTVIAPGDSATVVLEYSFLGYQRNDTVKVESVISSGTCLDSVELVLIGATVPKPDEPGRITGVRLVLPSNLTVTAGQHVTIPVALVADSSIAGRGLKDFEATLMYNPTVFRPTAVTPISPAVSNTSIVEVTPGTALLLVQSTTELDVAEPLVQIEGNSYLGNSTLCVLDVDTVRSDQADITAQDGLITVVGDCSITSQTVELGLAPSIIGPSVNSHHSLTDFTITTLTHDPVTLTIVGLDGKVVWHRTLSVAPGIHKIQLSTEDWATGLYGVVMQHGLYVGTSAFLLVP